MSKHRLAALAVSVGVLSSALPSAAWWTFPLDPLAADFAALTLAHLPDGRFLFGQAGQIVLQNTWGQPGTTPFANEPSPIDPSFIAIHRGGERAAIGAGGTGYSPLYSFAPSDPGSAFAPILTAYNYTGRFFSSNTLIVGGATFADPTHRLYAVAFDGSTNMLLLDDISMYSAGFDVDARGDLYVADNDNGNILRFARAQVAAAIAAGQPLAMNDGQLICDFGAGGDVGALRVDALGNLWGAGWMHNGLKVYNPRARLFETVVPSFDTSWYTLDALTAGGRHYIAFAAADGFFTGDAIEYGFDFAALYARPRSVRNDFTADQIAEGVFYDPPTGMWTVLGADGSSRPPVSFGHAAALPVPGDYDGDGQTDLAVFVPASGAWNIFGSYTGYRQDVFGHAATVPVPGDYDGDGRTDIAVYWPQGGMWYGFGTSSGFFSLNWGWDAAVPVPGDYDGDGRTDIAVFWPEGGLWHILPSTAPAYTAQWGAPGDVPTPADFDGDGRTDIAIYRPGAATWHISGSRRGPIDPIQWGAGATMVAPDDYNGDGFADIATRDPATGGLYVLYTELGGGSFIHPTGLAATARPVTLQNTINRMMGIGAQ